MRQRIIPAQITTVEDRFVGNVNFTQLMLLVIPLFIGMITYALFPQPMKLDFYKILIITLSILLCFVLALRIQGKVVLNWLVILLRYYIRPMYFLYNKNDSYLRTVTLPNPPQRQKKVMTLDHQKHETKALLSFSLFELTNFERYVASPQTTFSIKATKKGGLSVYLSKK